MIHDDDDDNYKDEEEHYDFVGDEQDSCDDHLE